MNNLFLVNETFTNGYLANILNIISLFAIFCGVFVIISKNPVVSVLFLIGLFGNIASYLILIGLGFMGLAYLVVYIGAISILFLFILMLINIRISELQSNTRNTIVRHCAHVYDGYLNISRHYTKMSLVRELGLGEIPRLKLASPSDGKISPIMEGRVACLAKFSMVKTELFQVYASGASLSGLQLAIYRLCIVISGMVW